MNYQKIIFYMIAAFMLSIIAPNVNTAIAAQGDIWLSPATQDVAVDTNFDIEVHIDTGTLTLGSYHLIVDFNRNNVTIDTTQGVNGISDGVGGGSFNNAINPGNSNEVILNGFDAFGVQGDDIHMATIHFKSDPSPVAGSTNIDIHPESVLLANEFGIDFPVITLAGNAVSTFPGAVLAPAPTSDTTPNAMSFLTDKRFQKIAFLIIVILIFLGIALKYRKEIERSFWSFWSYMKEKR